MQFTHNQYCIYIYLTKIAWKHTRLSKSAAVVTHIYIFQLHAQKVIIKLKRRFPIILRVLSDRLALCSLKKSLWRAREIQMARLQRIAFSLSVSILPIYTPKLFSQAKKRGRMKGLALDTNKPIKVSVSLSLSIRACMSRALYADSAKSLRCWGERSLRDNGGGVDGYFFEASTRVR